MKEVTAEIAFREHVKVCGEAGRLVNLPTTLSRKTCGNIMAEVAGEFIDHNQAIKAMIVLNERKRLNV